MGALTSWKKTLRHDARPRPKRGPLSHFDGVASFPAHRLFWVRFRRGETLDEL